MAMYLDKNSDPVHFIPLSFPNAQATADFRHPNLAEINRSVFSFFR